MQVFNLVMRDSIEERVLKTVAVKRELFEGVFAGGSDEINFGTLGHRTFLDTVRSLVMPDTDPQASGGRQPPVGIQEQGADAPRSPMGRVLTAGVEFAEAVAALVASEQGRPLLQGDASPELLARLAAAASAIQKALSKDAP